MSINYTAIYGYGYLVDADDCAKLSGEQFDDFCDSPFCILIDSWVESNCQYFFGLKLCQAEPGYAFALPSVDNYAHKDFIEMVRQFKSFFPDKDAFTIKHYLINRID